MGLCFSFPSLCTAGGAAVAAGLGVTGTVWSKQSSDKKAALEEKVKELQAQLGALKTQFGVFPGSLQASSETVANSESLIKNLKDRVEKILSTYQQNEENIRSAGEKVNKFSSDVVSSEKIVKDLESLIKNAEGKLETLVSEMPKHLSLSTVAMSVSEGAKTLATKEIQNLKEKAESSINQLFKKFEEKMNEELNKKAEGLEDFLNSRVTSLGSELKSEGKSFSDAVNKELQAMKEKMGSINGKVWEVLLKNHFDMEDWVV